MCILPRARSDRTGAGGKAGWGGADSYCRRMTFKTHSGFYSATASSTIRNQNIKDFACLRGAPLSARHAANSRPPVARRRFHSRNLIAAEKRGSRVSACHTWRQEMKSSPPSIFLVCGSSGFINVVTTPIQRRRRRTTFAFVFLFLAASAYDVDFTACQVLLGSK